jgi:hypothetical protein
MVIAAQQQQCQRTHGREEDQNRKQMPALEK